MEPGSYHNRFGTGLRFSGKGVAPLEPGRIGLADRGFPLDSLGECVAVLPEPHPHGAEDCAHETELPRHTP
jgi:hypothetical protein